MILDSEEQRQILLNSINSAQMTGMVGQLIPELNKVEKLIHTIQNAKVIGEVQEDVISS